MSLLENWRYLSYSLHEATNPGFFHFVVCLEYSPSFLYFLDSLFQTVTPNLLFPIIPDIIHIPDTLGLSLHIIL